MKDPLRNGRKQQCMFGVHATRDHKAQVVASRRRARSQQTARNRRGRRRALRTSTGSNGLRGLHRTLARATRMLQTLKRRAGLALSNGVPG
jgi:hypothetical protein